MAKPIEKFLLKLSVQTAVYWGTPANDGYGKITFDAPVEIAVRWDASDRVLTSSTGAQHISRAEVIVNQDVDEEGYLYLGVLEGLTVAQKADPKLVTGAYIIMRFDKVPMIFKTDEFVRKAFL